MRPVQPAEVTELLRRWSGGDVAARESLVPRVYDELRRLARYYLARQRSDHTSLKTPLDPISEFEKNPSRNERRMRSNA